MNLFLHNVLKIVLNLLIPHKTLLFLFYTEQSDQDKSTTFSRHNSLKKFVSNVLFCPFPIKFFGDWCYRIP